MPRYYKIKMKDFDKNYFETLLNFLNVADRTLNAVLMTGKDGYEIFVNRPFTVGEERFLYLYTRPITETNER